MSCCSTEPALVKAMADGVRGSAAFVLFLSKGVLDRPFVRFEVEEALKWKKKILPLHEADPSVILHGGLPFVFLVAKAAASLDMSLRPSMHPSIDR